jgi:hypothetical protein
MMLRGFSTDWPNNSCCSNAAGRQSPPYSRHNHLFTYKILTLLTVERALTQNTNLRVSYVGQATWHLPVTIDLNQIPASTTPYNPANGWADPRARHQKVAILMFAESADTRTTKPARPSCSTKRPGA